MSFDFEIYLRYDNLNLSNPQSPIPNPQSPILILF